MIIVYLKGGLGNQMFQYALARRLAEGHNTQLKMDVSAYDYDGPLEYYLGRFNIRENFASPHEVAGLTGVKQTPLGRRLYGLLHRHPKRPRSFVRWNRSVFNPRILKTPDDSYVEGYFCSERYFAAIENIIRREFSFRNPPAGRNAELAAKITSCDSVGVHVRRGDYVTDAKTNLTHGTCGEGYYRRCVEYIRQNTAGPRFFVFSDEPKWCRENLGFPEPATFVDCNGPENPCEDLRLMSLCRHNIIANSTFSWWAAWLNANEGKIILAPGKWFAAKAHNIDDILPAGWVRM
jgi:hypothetical protein